MKKVLVLGAGLVARPLVRYLLDEPEIQLLVASRTVSKAEALVQGHPDGTVEPLNIDDSEKLNDLISQSDLVISLVPYTYHVKVAEICLQHNAHLITTSYVSPAMSLLDNKAKAKNLLFLNEIGLDPGIDHMSAMKIIHHAQNGGGTVVSFESCCGGLPAPEANDNPFGYKFSWSPRGVVMAGRNPAHFLKDGKEVIIQGKDLFKHHWPKHVEGLGELEVYPNRDSMIYRDLYGLANSQTVFRGTFRNPGWCESLYLISRLGYLNDTQRPEFEGKTFAEVTASLIDAPADRDLKTNVARYLQVESSSKALNRLEWLGLFSDEKAPAQPPSALDILANRMLQKMAYKEGERDMIVLQHDFIIHYPEHSPKAVCSLLIDFGIPKGDSAMARTVSLPAAIAAKLVVQQQINLTGVQIPIEPEIYEPVLLELENLNIKFKETETDI